MKIYYHKNDQSVLVRKSTEPFEGCNCASDLDIDLTRYRVIVTQVRGDGWILGWKLEEPGEQALAPVVRTLDERVVDMERFCLELDYRQLLAEQGMGGLADDL